MSGFNPLTLAPFGEEHEEETGDEAGSRRRYNLERILKIGVELYLAFFKIQTLSPSAPL